MTSSLAVFQSVENTYIAIFQVVSALGLLLGSFGVAVLVLRHGIERRAELALLVALGFSRRRVRRLLILEHALLVVAGLAPGTACALLALVPAMRALAPLPLAIGMILVVGTGILAAAVAARIVLRGPLVASLRSE